MLKIIRYLPVDINQIPCIMQCFNKISPLVSVISHLQPYIASSGLIAQTLDCGSVQQNPISFERILVITAPNEEIDGSTVSYSQTTFRPQTRYTETVTDALVMTGIEVNGTHR